MPFPPRPSRRPPAAPRPLRWPAWPTARQARWDPHRALGQRTSPRPGPAAREAARGRSTQGRPHPGTAAPRTRHSPAPRRLRRTTGIARLARGHPNHSARPSASAGAAAQIRGHRSWAQIPQRTADVDCLCGWVAAWRRVVQSPLPHPLSAWSDGHRCFPARTSPVAPVQSRCPVPPQPRGIAPGAPGTGRAQWSVEFRTPQGCCPPNPLCGVFPRGEMPTPPWLLRAVAFCAP
jgi:hypothetical protein